MLTRMRALGIAGLGLVLTVSCSSPDMEGSTTTSAATLQPPKRPADDVTLTPADEPAAPDYRRLANETHDFTVGTLLAPSGSYRTTPGENRTDEWHVVSQIGADVSMIALADARYQPYIDSSFGFMNKLWDSTTPVGGYFATSAADGSNVDRSTKYVDDNSLAGVTWLDAHDALPDAGRRASYLASARSVANFLMTEGVWDDVHGGGFYWSTQKPDKPTQSNGLALQLFVRLSMLTGESYYRDWAGSVLDWLNGKMFDAKDGLYSWKWESAGRNDAKFTYDQAILIDAHLQLYAQTRNAQHLASAQALAEAMHRVLWDPANGGYVISTEDRRLVTGVQRVGELHARAAVRGRRQPHLARPRGAERGRARCAAP